MGQIRYYRCSFTPLGGYFFGGERNFPFGLQSLNEKKDYYVSSEDFPSQATLWGTLRFMLLEKAGLLNNGAFASNPADDAFLKRQEVLIGSNGFSMSFKDTFNPYGILKRATPLFIYDKRKGSRLIPAPLNHRVQTGKNIEGGDPDIGTGPDSVSHNSSNEKYAPLKMIYREGMNTDLGDDALLPEDYSAKSGLTDMFLFLDDNNALVKRNDVIGVLTQTRIARELEQGGLFKMEYKYLKGGYSFSVMIEVDIPEAMLLPGREEQPFCNSGTVFMGMDKSAFCYEVTEIDKKTFEELENDIKKIRMTDRDDFNVYYAASDCYKNTGQITSSLFWIMQKKNLRTLEKQDGRDYYSSMKKSRLYQMIKAGSVFYVKKDKAAEEEFLAQFAYPGLSQIGFNHVLKTGERV